MNNIKTYKILTINPGSTSTKVAVFENETSVLSKNLFHSSEEIEKYSSVAEQFDFRKEIVINYLKKENIDLCSLDAVVGRGGLLRPVSGGTYTINQEMLDDLQANRFGEHASDLGGMIAHDIAKRECGNLPAFIVNPIVVDELDDIARISGTPEIERKSIFHALNQKAMAIDYAKSKNKTYEEISCIVVHLGGGISVGAHREGRVIDVNNALFGEGPFSPERSGGLPARELINMAYSGDYTRKQLQKMVTGEGGLVAYLGTNDARKVIEKINNGDKESHLIYSALAYQIAKEVGSAATVLKGRVDVIILTGGIAHDPLLTELISERIRFISEVLIVPGEKEMQALAEGGLRVLRGEETAKDY